jgi:uncharacterized membrane protein
MSEKDKKDQTPAISDSPLPQQISELLESEAQDVLKQLSKEKREKLISIVKRYEICRHYQGPIPCPEDIALYNQHIPNGADRIMKMAEDQSKHRMELEKMVVSSQQKQSERGQIFGIVIGVLGIGVGGLLAYLGHDWIGGIIAGTTVISLVSVFVLGKKSQRANLESKQVNPPKG